jgi:hypothetical protein
MVVIAAYLIAAYQGAFGTWQDQHRIWPTAGSGREHAVRTARLAAVAAVA